MTKRIKFFAIILSLLLIVGLIGSIGATAAIWTSAGAGGGEDNKGTAVEILEWNAWAKYFAFQEVTGDDGIIITKFKNDASGNEMGFNDPVLIIPSAIDNKTVVGIAGGTFADSVLKEMVEEIYIPQSVTKICANAFSGFVNLRKVVFQADASGSISCNIEDFAFAGTSQFEIYKDEVKEGNQLTLKKSDDGKYQAGGLTFGANAFFGSDPMTWS